MCISLALLGHHDNPSQVVVLIFTVVFGLFVVFVLFTALGRCTGNGRVVTSLWPQWWSPDPLRECMKTPSTVSTQWPSSGRSLMNSNSTQERISTCVTWDSAHVPPPPSPLYTRLQYLFDCRCCWFCVLKVHSTWIWVWCFCGSCRVRGKTEVGTTTRETVCKCTNCYDFYLVCTCVAPTTTRHVRIWVCLFCLEWRV